MSEVRRDEFHGEDVDNIKKKDYKLLVDPQLRKGEEKLLRYDGVAYNTSNHGQGIVVLRDPRPRMNRLWSRRERAELPVPRYKVDEWYIGAVPPREVTFSRLNDNITKQFMEKMCIKFGKMERVRVYYHPKTQKHMGLSKVVFSSIKSASECVNKLHMTSIMGNVIHAQIDCKGELLNKLFNRIVKGEMLAETIPDVIRHTQDGITMSNKYKEHHHHHHHSAKKERRKSSQDDPRKLRRSLDSKNKVNIQQSATQQHRPSHDKEPKVPQREEQKNVQQRAEMDAMRQEISTPPPIEPQYQPGTKQQRTESSEHSEQDREDQHTDSDDSKSEKQRVWSSDLESRISSLLHEQTKKYNLDDGPPKNDQSISRNERSHSKDGEIHVKKESRKKKKSHKREKQFSTESGDSGVIESSKKERKSRRRLSEQNSREIIDDKSITNRHLSKNISNSRSPPIQFKRSPREHFDSPRENEQIRNIDIAQPRRDVEFIHDSRSRSPKRHPAYFEPTGRQYFDPHHNDRYTPPYRARSPRHSPGYRDRRIKPEYHDRERFDRDFERFPMYGDEERRFRRNTPDYQFRRREMTPPRGMPSPRRHRPHSPNRWIPPDRYQNDFHHQRRHSPPPPRREFYGHSSSRERSPRNWRRTPSPEQRYKHRFEHPVDNRSSSHDRHRARTPSPKRRQRKQSSEYIEKPSTSSTRKESSDKDSPKLTLEERLKEMTGEVSSIKTEKEAQHSSEKNLEEVVSKSERGSSVDMEISEDESESDKLRKAEEANKNRPIEPHPPGFVLKQEPVNFERIPWNGFGPRVNVPPMHMDSRMWNPMQPEYFKGFQRDPRFPVQFQPPNQFPQTRWPDPFHPPIRGMHPPQFGLPPNVPPPRHGFNENSEEMQKRFDDRILSQKVLDGIVLDLKSIVSRDLNRKVIETMAFKVYEAWWDQNDNTKKLVTKTVPSTVLTDRNTTNDNAEIGDLQTGEVKSGPSKENRSLLNTFDPLNWAKNSFEMDGFRIGLGLRSAISKMPSFRVKKRPRTPSPPRENQENAQIPTKARKIQDKENQVESHKKSTKEKKYQRITLGSEGEDESSEQSDVDDDSASEADGEERYKVLDVDEIFSGSSESSEESESESEKEETSESDSEAHSDVEKPERTERKPGAPLVDEEASKDSIERQETSEQDEVMDTEDSETAAEKPKPHVVDATRLSGDEPHIAASLLSPTAQGITTASAITPQQLRHVHPKKRHRLLSQDPYEFAKIPDKLKSDSEASPVDKDTVPVVTPDIPKTPGRQPSTNSDLSSPLLPLTTDAESPIKLKKEKTTADTSDMDTQQASPKSLYEATSSTLSIRKTIPPISPQTDTTASATSPILTHNRKKRLISLANEDKARMAELAEEHNYFVPTYGPSLPPQSLDPIIAQILEEHCYSRPVAEQLPSETEKEKGVLTPQSLSTLSTGSVFNFEDDFLDVISAAERVKLRHIKPDRKKRASKKERRQERHQLEFSPRSEVEDLEILYEMWYNGLDLEDMKHLRTVYESYLEKSNSPAWVNESHWVPHPITNIPNQSSKHRKQKRRSRSDKTSPEEEEGWHKTGCARTEGYYKMADMVKLRQRREMYGKGDSLSTVKAVNQSCSGQGKELTSGAQGALDKNLGSRETRHFMRRIASEVGSDAGDLFKYNQLMFRKKAVKFKRSSIHGWGLFAEEPIAADEMVIEYVGQVVRTLIAERREVHYTEIGIGSSYLFRIDSEHIIDATKCGNYARFMNHSCNPSCYAKVITVDNAKKIVIYSKGPIKKSQEITYDYKFPLEDDKIMCFCGAENCRRTLN